MGQKGLIHRNIVRKLRLVFITSIVLSGAGMASAQVKTVRDLSAPVLPGSTVRYSDLVKLLFTDLSGDTRSATTTIRIRHVSGDHEEMPLHGDFQIDSFEVVELRDPQGPCVLIQIDITTDDDSRATVYGSESSLIAAFRLSPTVKLLDAMDIKTDRFTGILEKQSVVSIGPKQSAFFISNTHSNSNQSYQLISGFYLSRDRLRPIFTAVSGKNSKADSSSDLFLLSDRGFDDKTNCNVDTDETIDFFPIPQPGKAYFKLGVRVRVTKEQSGDECKRPARHSTYYRGAWEWDPAHKRFRPSPGGTLEQLDKFNERGL